MRTAARQTTQHLALIAIATIVAVGADARRSGAQDQSQQVTDAIDRANDLIPHRHMQEALDALREADRLSNHTCAECYLGMANLDCQLGDLPAALDDARHAEQTAGDNPVLASQALTLRAAVLLATASGPNDEKAKESEGEYHEALSLNPKNSLARFELGVLLFAEQRDPEGVAELKAYVSGPFANPRYVDRANRFIADPSRARALASDDFSFSTLDGRQISKAGLRGKVVLLDFWGSWCPPCRESVPIMAGLHKKFQGRDFELVGISSDADEETLRSFTSANHMTWPEFLDTDGQISGLFEVKGFPSYVILGRGGTIEYRQLGLDGDTAEHLESIIKRELAKTYTGPPPDLSAAPAAHPAPALVAAAAPPPALDIVVPPDDVENGDADNGVYRNAFLSLAYKYPAAWPAATAEMLDQFNHSRTVQLRSRGAIDAIESTEPNGALRVAFSELVFEASPDLRRHIPSVQITVAQGDSLTLEFVQKEAADLKTQGMTILAPPAPVTIAQRQFFRTDAQSAELESDHIARFETIVSERYRVTLEIRASSKRELDQLASSAQSLVISKP